MSAGTRAGEAGLSASTQRAARLFQQLLAFGSLDPEARGDLDCRPANLVALAQGVVRGRQAIGEGSGLGLAIVCDIVTIHGAAVTLTNSP